jgi:hypothetical protein
MVLDVGQNGGGTVQDLVYDVARVIVGAHRAMKVRRAHAKALRELQLEVAQAAEAKRTAEADHRWRADISQSRKLLDIGANARFGVIEKHLPDLSLGRGQ